MDDTGPSVAPAYKQESHGPQTVAARANGARAQSRLEMPS